jgi:TolA-binding protein
MPESKQNELVLHELVRRANVHTQRLRNIDEQIRRLNTKIESIEQQKIKDEKTINEKFEKIMESIKEINRTIDELKNEVTKLNEKSKNFAKKREIEELSELLNLLSPIRHEFVTWSEFNREIKKLKNEIAIST